MKELKLSTAVTIVIGPMLSTTGAPVTTLTLAALDSAHLYKNGSTTPVDLKATSTLAHLSGGVYSLTFSIADTNTLGGAGQLVIRDDSEIVQYVEDILILSAAHWDWKYGATKPAVNMVEIDGLATATQAAVLKLKQLDIQNSGGSALIAKSTGGNGHGIEATGQGTGEGLVGTGGATGDGIRGVGGSTSGNGFKGEHTGASDKDYGGDIDVTKIAGSSDAATALSETAPEMAKGTVDNTAFVPTTTIFEASGSFSAQADNYVGRLLQFLTGAIRGQATGIVDYSLVGGRGHFTVNALTLPPSNGDTFRII